MNNISETAIFVISFIIAIVCHEYAHGYSAYILGDPTAKYAGRLTLNPLAHIDPLGLIVMLIFRFGWAKGVPINPNYFKNRKRDTIIVSASGIITNLFIAIVASILFKLFGNLNLVISNFLLVLSYVNVMLAVFNLMPFPPLDGSKILISLLPKKMEYFFLNNEKYFYFILIGLILTNTIGRIILPIINLVLGLLYS